MQTSGKIPAELLGRLERLDLVSRRHVRMEIRYRCRTLTFEAYYRWYLELVGAIERGEVELEDMMRWRPAALPANTEKG